VDVDGFDTIRAKFWTRVVISSDHDVFELLDDDDDDDDNSAIS